VPRFRFFVTDGQWAAFRQSVDNINKTVKAVAQGDETVKFREHIGGAHYISMTSSYKCIDFRQWYQPAMKAVAAADSRRNAKRRLLVCCCCQLLSVVDESCSSKLRWTVTLLSCSVHRSLCYELKLL